MPPLLGIYTLDRNRPDEAMIRRMSQQVKYHVPRSLITLEQEGCWLASALVESESGIQGSRYLHRSGGILIAADASLYKREELVRELNNNHPTIEISDATLILDSYRAWGDQCVKHIYGDYAFIIVNTEKNEIFCGRDCLGVRPFFYAIVNNCFVFGSELRYVTAFFENKPEMDENYRLETLVTVKSAKDRSPYKGIFRLPPGCCLTYRNEKTTVTQYWQSNSGGQIDLKHESEYVELFRDKLIQAVTMQCRDANRIGAELSGGLDSSAVTGIAADCSKEHQIPFTAFSNVFPADSNIEFRDEREFIAKMTEFKKMEWMAVDRMNAVISELLKKALEIQGCYIQQNFSIFNQGIYEAAGNMGIDVLLSGFGGDEMVSARTAVQWNEIIRAGQWNILFDELFHKGMTVRATLKLFRIFARYLVAGIHKQPFKTGVFTKELLDKRFAMLPLQPDFSRENNLRQSLSGKHRMPTHSRLAERQVERLMADHVPQRMEYCYAAAAQYGLEYRYPLLDVDLIETYLAFPPWLKQHHGVNRYVFRQAIKDFVPEEIRNRDDKSGTTIPHVYHSLVNEKESILSLIQEASSSRELNEIFDFNRFPEWYEKLVLRDEKEMNYLMPGAFYQYLMMLLCYK